MCSKQLWEQHATFPHHNGGAGPKDDHYDINHHPAAADGDYSYYGLTMACPKKSLAKQLNGEIKIKQTKNIARSQYAARSKSHRLSRCQFVLTKRVFKVLSIVRI